MANDIIGAPEPIQIEGITIWLSPLSQLRRTQLSSWVRMTSDHCCSGEMHDYETYDYLSTKAGVVQILRLSTTLTESQIAAILDADAGNVLIVFDFFMQLMDIPKYLIEDSLVTSTESNDLKPSSNNQDSLAFTLIEALGYTPNQLADMTEVQQLILIKQLANKVKPDSDVNGVGKRSFTTEEEYNEWLADNYHRLNK